MSSESPQETTLIPGKDFPSVPELLGLEKSKRGALDIPEHSSKPCEYDLKRTNNDSIIALIKIPHPSDGNIESRNFSIRLSSKGKLMDGNGTGKYKDGRIFDRYLDSDQMIRVLKYLQPLVDQLKLQKEEQKAPQKEQPKKENVPQFPRSAAWLGVWPGSDELLTPEELKKEKYIVNRYQDLPANTPELPPENFAKLYVHTDRCSFMMERSRSLFSTEAPNGCYVFYFPKLDDSVSGKEGKLLNEYLNALVFPVEKSGKSSRQPNAKVAMALRIAYRMAQEGRSDSEIYNELRPTAHSFEREFRKQHSTLD